MMTYNLYNFRAQKYNNLLTSEDFILLPSGQTHTLSRFTQQKELQKEFITD